MIENQNISNDITVEEKDGGGNTVYELSPEDLRATVAMQTTKELQLRADELIQADTCVCCPERAEHWFKLTVHQTADYSFTANTHARVGARLYNEDGEPLASDNVDGESNTFLINYPLLQGLVYYLRITPTYSHFTRFSTIITGTFTPVESVSISTDTVSLIPKEAVTLSATVLPENATMKTLIWSSSDDNIAEVDDFSGVVTAVSPGTATISARTLDGSGLVVQCSIKVKGPGYYYIINPETGKVVNIKGSYLLELEDGNDITLYKKTSSNEQIWKIDTLAIEQDTFIKSYIDEDYGFNVYRGDYNCNVHKINGNETDATVEFENAGDSKYKIKLSNYGNYYLTATDSGDGSTIKWKGNDNSDSQFWCLEEVDFEQREAEKVEYHLIPCSDISNPNKRALQVDMNTPNDGGLVNKTYRLANDEPLELATFSYVNKQKWLIKGTGSECKIYTPHGDNYCLCKKEGNKVYVSNKSTVESLVTVNKYNNSNELVEIKLTASGLYLTVQNGEIVWAAYDNTDHSTQVWKKEGLPSNLHNGCDTCEILYDGTATDKDRTIRACSLGGEKFVVRYYAKIENNDKVLTKDEAGSLKDRDINIVSVYQDAGNADQYFSSELGIQNAIRALELAESLEQPYNSAIYFAVDYDASTPTQVENVKKYFAAVQQVFAERGNKYKIGVYGSGLVCRTIKETYATYSWLNPSTGHQEYTQYDSPSKYNIKQAERIRYNNIVFDDCIAVGDDYGQWYK